MGKKSQKWWKFIKNVTFFSISREILHGRAPNLHFWITRVIPEFLTPMVTLGALVQFLQYIWDNSNSNLSVCTSSFSSPEATLIPIWKTSVCKRGVCKRGFLKCPVSYVLNSRGWIKLIYNKITLIYSIKNVFNPTSEVQNIDNRVFQNAPFANVSLPNGDKNCLWAMPFFLA